MGSLDIVESWKLRHFNEDLSYLIKLWLICVLWNERQLLAYTAASRGLNRWTILKTSLKPGDYSNPTDQHPTCLPLYLGLLFS